MGLQMNSSVLICGRTTGDSLVARVQGVANELKCADMWQNDWGFLGGQSASGENKSMTKEEKIAALEAEVKKLGSKSMTTTSNGYGTQPKAVKDLEMFSMKHNNIQKDPDLMPCPRRPPKK